jgi:CARDB
VVRRIAVTAAVLAAASGGVAGARPSAGADAPTTLVKLSACDTAGLDRSAVFYARVDAIPGATRMAIRFSVLEKLGRAGDWTRVDVPALRQWHRSAPGVKTFGYRQTVDNLRVGGFYKARVTFRWSDADGDPVDSEVRETPVCRGALPNLTVGSLAVRPGPTQDTRSYRVTVDNDGSRAADAVDVVLTIDRAVLDKVTIDQLDAGDSRTISFTGPACARSVRVRVDPANTIGELDETDNAQSFACP